MQFDPALAARTAFDQAVEQELGRACAEAIEAEEVFSSTAGPTAQAAYDRLQELGVHYPDARAFQEFLIYITWQQFAEEMTSRCLHRGLDLCDRYLEKWGTADAASRQVKELQDSFSKAAGADEPDDHDYDRDTFKGGD